MLSDKFGLVTCCAERKDNDGKARNIIVPTGITELTAAAPVVKMDSATSTTSTVRQALTAMP